MDRRTPPPTEEGWYALHDFRRIDWDAWRAAGAGKRDRAIQEGIEYLEHAVNLADADAGGSASFSVVGHKADLLFVHLRPTLQAVDRLERQFEQTALARFTDQPTSYVSVTEVSGYTTDALDEGLDQVEDAGLRNYLQTRLHPSIPDATHVSFYPMDKRREPEYNWYDLPFEERAELMEAHGEIGREYAGEVTQIITGSVGLDDFEWGVTLFADDLTAIKHLLYEMRFDPSSSRFAEFGPFYVGTRLSPDTLPALLNGEGVGEVDAETSVAGHASSTASTSAPGPGSAIDETLEALGVDPSEWEGHHALIYDAESDADDLEDEVAGLRENFDHYDRHVHTSVTSTADGAVAVISVWTAAEAAETAGGFLADLPGVELRCDGPVTGGQAAADGAVATGAAEDLRERLADLGIYGGQPHGEDVYALVRYAAADPSTLTEAVDEVRREFQTTETHVQTDVYRERRGDRTAMVSLWETEAAAGSAAESLATLPGLESPHEADDGFATMGMFYTVDPAHRDAFIDRFAEVGELLAEMDGHRETTLFVNVADANDTFIASRWRSREDAMAFFRSEDFAETVSWGREILADRPRHVFLA